MRLFGLESLLSVGCFWDLLTFLPLGVSIYNTLLNLLFLHLTNSLNLSTVSLPSICVLQAAFLHSCVDFPPTGCSISAHVHCICSIHGRDPSSIVQTLILCSYSLMISHLIQRETQSPWIGYRPHGHPFSWFSSLASPECYGQVFPSSFLSPLSGILVLRSLHGISPHLLQVFGHLSLS